MLETRGVDLEQPIVFPEATKFADEGQLTALCEAFMREFGRGAVDAAFNLLEGRAAWPDAEMNALREKTKSQLALIRPRYGDFVGHEFIRSEMVGTSLVRYVYLARLENQPLRCTFLFYKPADKWILNSFVWDDQIKLLWEPGG